MALVLVTPRLAWVVETDTREFRGETLNRLLSLWQDYIDPTLNLEAILRAAPPPANLTFYGAQAADVHLAPVSDPDVLRAVVDETVAQLR